MSGQALKDLMLPIALLLALAPAASGAVIQARVDSRSLQAMIDLAEPGDVTGQPSAGQFVIVAGVLSLFPALYGGQQVPAG